MTRVSREVSKSVWFPVPVMKLTSQDGVVPMLLASKLLGSSHANVLIHLDMQVAQENRWNHLDD